MKKLFVLDTNVLLHDPNALFAFEDNEVVVPIYVIEEIDQFKKDLNELGRNARTVSRYLDEFREKGSLATGVDLSSGGTLRVLSSARKVSAEFQDSHLMDNKIISVALDLMEREKEKRVIFVTKDVNLRIRADALGLKAENYERDLVDINELYMGFVELALPGNVIDDFYTKGGMDIPTEPAQEYFANQYVLLRDAANASHTALGRVRLPEGRVEPLAKRKESMWGLRARNKEQSFAIDLLLNDDIKLVTIAGKAGTGKTLIAIAAGLQKVVEENVFHRMLVSRPVFPLGRDIGYLPGDLEEKLNPWMQPIFDNIELLMGLTKESKKGGRGYHELIDMGIVDIEPLTYIRGRSIPNQYLIVDEAQNLTPHEVKTIITRCGDNTKIILTGDPYQIDNPYVDTNSNGLIYVVNRFRREPIAGHITLLKGERSPLAELASNIL